MLFYTWKLLSPCVGLLVGIVVSKSFMSFNRQISPFGVLLKSIFSYGVVLKDISAGGTFARKVHAWPKQIASGTGKFAVGEGLAIVNGDMHMQGEELATGNGDIHSKGNRQFDWLVPTT